MWSPVAVCSVVAVVLAVGIEAQNPVFTNQIQQQQQPQPQAQPASVFSTVVQQQQQQPQMQQQFQQAQPQLQIQQPQQPQQNMANPFQLFFPHQSMNSNPFPVQAPSFQQTLQKPQIMAESFPILTRIMSAFRQALTGNKQQQQGFNQQQQFLPIQQQQQQQGFFSQSNAIVQPMQASNIIFDVVPPTTRKPLNLFGDLFG